LHRRVHPDDADARRAIDCLVTLQARAGGNALIGRQVFPLLAQAGLRNLSIAGLRRAAEPDGVFCYTFFKGVGVKCG
jgi:hypothetical protein